MIKLSDIKATFNYTSTKDGEVKSIDSILCYDENGHNFIAPNECILPNGKVGNRNDIYNYVRDKYGII